MIGMVIRRAREKRQMSQKELSERLGLTSSQFISNIERGLAAPPIHFFPVLHKLLGLSEEEFVEALVTRYRRRCLDELKRHHRSSKTRRRM
jgi:transcriptional regulator with XRE-family HTH domain